MDVVIKEDHSVTSIAEDHETTCWGCGLRLLLPSYTPIFKCGWCGAITNQNPHKQESQYLLWRHLRDRFFVSILLLFIVFVICGGIWAVYPLLFSISYFCGVSHCIITIILSLSTISCFSLAAFCCAGPPPSILWGSYPLVGKGGLENYTFCSYCSKPKSPRTHHCRSCGMCILDMDHHCPFIGNCVGASNHRSFIAFLISAVISTMYASIMCAYVGFQIWPSVDYGSVRRVISLNSSSGYKVLLEIAVAFLNSAVFLSTRGLVLVYLFIASLSVKLGLCVLLWQQLHYIYKGKTYLSHLASQTDNDDEEKGCHNIFRFFGCHTAPLRMLPRFSNTKKNHKKGT